MFGSFNPNDKKRKAETSIEQLKRDLDNSDEEMIQVTAEAADLNADAKTEEDRIIKQAQLSLTHQENESGRVGYDSADFVCKRNEYDNCTHEFVAPKGYERPADWRRPKVKPKQYKFTLDKF